MKRAISVLFFFGLSVLWLILSSSTIAQDNRSINNERGRYALVIGNGSYKVGPLENPVNDARVLAQMEVAGNNMNIIILDACRNNPFARSFRSSKRGLAKMDAPTGSIIAYATAPGSVAADGVGRNGLYTSRLLVHMNQPNLKVEEVFKKVRIDVVKESVNKQVPWESSSLIGDFYFVPKTGNKTVESSSTAATTHGPKPPLKDSGNQDDQLNLAEKEPSSWRVIISAGKIFSDNNLKMLQIACMVANKEKEFEILFANGGNGIGIKSKRLEKLYGKPSKVEKNLDLNILLRPGATGISYSYGKIGVVAEESTNEIIGLYVPKESLTELSIHLTNILNN